MIMKEKLCLINLFTDSIVIFHCRKRIEIEPNICMKKLKLFKINFEKRRCYKNKQVFACGSAIEIQKYLSREDVSNNASITLLDLKRKL